MATYSAIREVVAEFVQRGSVSNEGLFAFVRAVDKVEFLFGPEVKAYLEDLYFQLVKHQEAESLMKNSKEDMRSQGITNKYDSFKEIADFYKRFPPLLSRYARMDQKVPFWRVKRLTDWCRSKWGSRRKR